MLADPPGGVVDRVAGSAAFRCGGSQPLGASGASGASSAGFSEAALPFPLPFHLGPASLTPAAVEPFRPDEEEHHGGDRGGSNQFDDSERHSHGGYLFGRDRVPAVPVSSGSQRAGVTVTSGMAGLRWCGVKAALKAIAAGFDAVGSDDPELLAAQLRP